MNTNSPTPQDIQKWRSLGRALDSLVATDIVNRGICHQLYDYVYQQTGSPLTMTAALALEKNINPGDVVFIATGWPSRSWLMKGITETDGPVGAAYLARFIEECFGAIPIIVTEQSLTNFSQVALRAAGLIVADLEIALQSKKSASKASVASVIAFTTSWDDSKKAAQELLENIEPKAVIAIEIPGANRNREFHNVTGRVVPTELVAKVDAIIEQANLKNILTVAIGDGGNELGMGNAAETIKQHLKNGEEISPVTKVDHLIISSVSNFGAAGLAAGIAALKGNLGIFSNVDLVRITERVSDAGAIDGLSAYLDPKNDGVNQSDSLSLMRLLALTVNSHLKGWQKG